MVLASSPDERLDAGGGGVELLTPHLVERFDANGDGQLASVHLRHALGGGSLQLAADGAFIAIGQLPRSELVAGQLPLDDHGHVLVEPGSTRTLVPGVFAAGEVADLRFRQAVTAAGSGAQAALEALAWLQAPTTHSRLAERAR